MTSSLTSTSVEQPSLQLYPNPVTSDGFSLRSGKSVGQYQIEILSSDGKLIESRKTKIFPESSASFEAPQSSGMYYLRWIRGDERGVIPFMVP